MIMIVIVIVIVSVVGGKHTFDLCLSGAEQEYGSDMVRIPFFGKESN